MSLRERVALTALSLLLPLLAVGLLVLFTVGSVTLAASDRAIVWAEATPSRLNAIEHRVRANPWFGGGRSLAASESTPLPAECHPGARQFSFGGLREGEAQAAREILELIATEAGGTICLTNMFVINERPDQARQHGTQALASTLLNTSLIPASLLLIAYLAMAGPLRLAAAVTGSPSVVERAGVAAAGTALAWLMLSGLSGAAWLAGHGDRGAQAMSVDRVGPGLALALMVVVPAMMELAFRGWMLPLAERAMGTGAAVVLTVMASTAASLPTDAWQASRQLTLGLVLTLVYVKTRSLAACILASVLLSVAIFFGH